MAVQNHPSLYTGGNVVFDSSPTVNLYGQLLQRKQAKDDAIDEYYRKLPSTVNSAGMRDQDRAGLDQKLAEWQKYWMQNKDKIRKGNGQEAFESEQRFRQIQEAVQRSKDAAKTDLELGKMRFSKENGYIFDDPDFVSNQAKHALPIWDTNHKQLDLGTVAIPAKPFETEDQDKLWASVTKGLTPGKSYDYSKQKENPKTGQVIVPFEKKFDDKQIEKIADQMAASVKGNKSAILHYNKILNNPDSEAWQELQKAYGKYYSGIVDTPEKAAAAEAIIRATVPQEIGEEQESNFQQKQQASVNKIYIQDALIRGRQRGGTLPEEIAQYDILRKYEPDAQKKTIKEKVSGGMFPKYEEKEITIIPATKVDKYHQEMIGVKPYEDGKDGSRYYVLLPDGNWEGRDKQVVKWDVIAQKEMDKASQNEVRRGRQDMGSQRPSSKSTYQPVTPVLSHTKDEFLKAGWTEDQIQKAAKAGKIKIK